jgi:hypothetical protein
MWHPTRPAVRSSDPKIGASSWDRWVLSRAASSCSTASSRFALLETLFARRLLAQEVRPTAEAWVRDLRERCCDLHRHALEPREWQTSVERLFAQVPLLDLLRAIEFERLAAGLKLPDDRAGTRDVTLPEVRGLSDCRS